MRKKRLYGLENLWLQNGYEILDGEPHPLDPDGLSRAVALELCHARHRLSADGIRYLRQFIALAPAELDRLLGLETGTVQTCECSTTRLPETSSMQLRCEALKALGEQHRVEAQTLAPANKLVFALREAGWRCTERAEVPALLQAAPLAS